MDRGRIPTFEDVTDALEMVTPKAGLHHLEGKLWTWNCCSAECAHEVPEMYNLFTAEQLAQVRCESVMDLLECNKVSLRITKTRSLLDILNRNRKRLLPLIPKVCERRLKTCTLWVRNERGDFQLVNLGKGFRNPGLDYSDICDGGARIVGEIGGYVYAELTWSEYLETRGGNMSVSNFERHRIVQTLFPDESLRKKYLYADGIIKLLKGENPKNSVWIPREMKPGYARCVDLGTEDVALYPPNATTADHSVICTPIPAKS